ncbi:AlpA family phage regulatory protein [Vibrio sp. RE86]|uniref:helix-turn-helix transcriptional regulator n=1 Tax=Vibrio sp. RE86 TaxID=2607605 RepID=UPI001493AAA9|nr:AlpA family phage regulatory protein [Vibrio sp. RE86]
MRLFTVKQVCAQLGGISYTTLTKLRRTSDFPKPVMVNNNRPRWRTEDIDTWVYLKTQQWEL